MYVETHPFEEFIPKDAKSLIVGSFPPINLTVKDIAEVSGQSKTYYVEHRENNECSESDIDFYYGSRKNLFWRLMREVFDLDYELNSPEVIKSFLESNMIGITDIFQKCKRKPVKSATKTDPNRMNIGASDSALEIEKHRDVLESIKVNKIKKVLFTSKYVKDKFERRYENGCLEGINFEVLPSPSTAANGVISTSKEFHIRKNSRVNYNTKDYRIEVYKEMFGIK